MKEPKICKLLYTGLHIYFSVKSIDECAQILYKTIEILNKEDGLSDQERIEKVGPIINDLLKEGNKLQLLKAKLKEG